MLVFAPDFLRSIEADRIFDHLLKNTLWEQQHIKLFGKKQAVPRLTAWHADPGVEYQYSGIRVLPKGWTTELLEIKRRLEQLFESSFNSVLINRYRSGKDSVDWHADDEKELGNNPVIASVSLGATRRFRLKHRIDKNESYFLDLTHGSALLMGGTTQHYWRHKIPKSKKCIGERLNLTFRKIENI